MEDRRTSPAALHNQVYLLPRDLTELTDAFVSFFMLDPVAAAMWTRPWPASVATSATDLVSAGGPTTPQLSARGDTPLRTQACNGSGPGT